jgi:hypothetical protein
LQPKLELYGLYRALGALRLYLIGVRNLIVEVDARYIKDMLSNPDIAPSASINRWIVSILMFHFTLVHVTGTHHSPDGLSRRPPQPEDESIHCEEDFGDWIDHLHGFIHQINPLSTCRLVSHSPLPTYSLPIDFSKGEEITYDQVPHPECAIRDDAHLIRV